MELAWICEASGREFKRVPAELAAAAERQAKAALADSDMCALRDMKLPQVLHDCVRIVAAQRQARVAHLGLNMPALQTASRLFYQWSA